MRNLLFEPVFDASSEKIWEIVKDVNNYSNYIEFCQKSELFGDFREGSHWIDHSTVAFVPMDIKHEIIKIVPQKEIIYKINLPSGGALWQKFYFEPLGERTKLRIEIEINFTNKLVDALIGQVIYRRNQIMIETTINNFKKGLS
ncbi:MAG TPA: SRPBCC family protein [Candidatus Saccharimonadales bacterium]|nr:SRPBCC family protein [Candidatus Saccharimonadales bacterium]